LFLAFSLSSFLKQTMSFRKRARDEADEGAAPAVHTAEDETDSKQLVAEADAHAKRRRRGDPKYERFDMNVRLLWEALDELGSAHLIFEADGVVDVMVEYARHILPLYAKLPDRIGGQLNIGLDTLRAFYRRDNFDLPVGATFSCLNPLHGNHRADAIVVVPPDLRLVSVPRRPKDAASGGWCAYVGVIVPAFINCPSGKPYYGADRTLYLEQIQQTDDWKTMSAEECVKPPLSGYYAVHYVNVMTQSIVNINPLTKRFVVCKPFVGNSSECAISDAASSRERVHLLPTEIDHSQLEAQLLEAIRMNG
jgi:hypothetical protein